jgi:hypothetical protein
MEGWGRGGEVSSRVTWNLGGQDRTTSKEGFQVSKRDLRKRGNWQKGWQGKPAKNLELSCCGNCAIMYFLRQRWMLNLNLRHIYPMRLSFFDILVAFSLKFSNRAKKGNNKRFPKFQLGHFKNTKFYADGKSIEKSQKVTPKTF